MCRGALLCPYVDAGLLRSTGGRDRTEPSSDETNSLPEARRIGEALPTKVPCVDAGAGSCHLLEKAAKLGGFKARKGRTNRWES